jgi:tetratricopeptide (TPR) repeat protein
MRVVVDRLGGGFSLGAVFPRSMKNWLTIFGRLALVVAAPVVFFGGLELVVFLTGRFEPVRVVERVRHEGREYWSPVPEFGSFALRREAAPQPKHFWVPVERTPGTLRVVVVGESAAAGFPGHEFNMARMLDAAWRERFPDRPIEAVNLTMVGVSSHLLRGFVREGMALEPDALVLYMGHNEVVGPYGPAGRLAGFYPRGWMARASLAVRNTRTGRFLEWVTRPKETAKQTVWSGLNEFQGARVAADDAVLKAMTAQTKENVRAMVEMARKAGCKVLVCVPAVNLTDWPPLASAEGGVETSAEAVYARGKDLQATGRMEEAWEFYRKACDLDEIRLRADSRVRGVQREVVAAMASKDVMLVDADIWLHEENRGSLTDRDFFLEHVHLTFEGRVAVAELMVDGLAELLGVGASDWADAQAWWEVFPERVEAARERVMFTEFHEARILTMGEGVAGLGLFAGMPDEAERRQRLGARARELKRNALVGFDEEEILQRHARAVESNPADPWPDVIASQIFYAAGRRQEAMELKKRAEEKAPTLVDAALGFCIEALGKGRVGEAMGHLKEVERLQPKHELVPWLYDQILKNGGDLTEAVPYLERRLKDQPRDFLLWSNLALAQEKRGQIGEAMKSYRRGLALRKNDPVMLNNLAWLLATRPDGTEEEREEAVKKARKAVAQTPLAHRHRGTLAVALLADGRAKEGLAEAKEAIAMAREAGDLESVRELERRFAPRTQD